METLIEEDLHWWLWSQSTCRVDLDRPAGALNLLYIQEASLTDRLPYVYLPTYFDNVRLDANRQRSVV